MLNLICSIPENIGWVIVGAMGMLTAIEAVKLGKLLIQMWKDYHRDETEAEEAVA